MDTAAQATRAINFDLLALRHIDSKLLCEETDLAKSCWWDYQGLHPTQRTYTYARVYAECVRRFTAKYRDYERSEFTSGLKGHETEIFPTIALENCGDDERKKKALRTKKSNLTALWKGRQTADRLGINYSIYVASIFEKASAEGWQHLPRPQQMYSDRMQQIAVAKQVDELTAFVPEFKNAALQAGSPAPFKLSFDNWLKELGVVVRKNPSGAYQRMVDLGYITQATSTQWCNEVFKH